MKKVIILVMIVFLLVPFISSLTKDITLIESFNLTKTIYNENGLVALYPKGIATNETSTSSPSTFYIIDSYSDAIWELNSSFYNNTANHDVATESGADNPLYLDTNNSDYYFYDNSDNFVYHLDSTFNNVTNGFSKTSIEGLTLNSTNLFFPTCSEIIVYDMSGTNTHNITITGGFSCTGVQDFKMYNNEMFYMLYYVTTSSSGYVAKFHINGTYLGDRYDISSLGSISPTELNSFTISSPNDAWIIDYLSTGGEVHHIQLETTINLTECGTLDDPNVVYELQNNVYASGTCFNILANNITLDGNNYTIFYAQSDGTSGGDGIVVDGFDDSTIKNMNILLNRSSLSSGPRHSDGIVLKDSEGHNISNVNMTIGGETSGTGHNNGIDMDDINLTTIDNVDISTTGYRGDAIEAIPSSIAMTDINITNFNLTATGPTTYGIEFDDVNDGISNVIFKHGFLSGKTKDLRAGGGTGNGDYQVINVTYDSESTISPVIITRKWYMDVQVNYTNGTATEGANVSLHNISSVLQFTELTSASGQISQQIVTEYVNTGSKTIYNNQTLNVTKTGYDTNSTILNITTNQNLQVQLGDSTAPSITLDYPITAPFFNSNDNINFNFTATDVNLDYCELYGNWSGGWHKNETFSNPTSGIQVNTKKNITDGFYRWNVWCNDTGGLSQFNDTNYTFTVDTTKPQFMDVGSTTTQGSQTITFDFNVTEINLDSCWYSVYNSTGDIDPATSENTSINCNSTGNSVTVSAFATYNLTIWANDSAGNDNLTIETFTTVATPPGGDSPGGGGTTIVEGISTIEAVNFSITTTNLLSQLDIALARDSVKERSKQFAITNFGLEPIEVNVYCDTEGTNASSGEINICDYVTFENITFIVSPIEEERSIGTFNIITPENSSFDDVYFFNIVVEKKEDSVIKFSKLSVSARVNLFSSFYKWSFLPFQEKEDVEKISYPVIAIALTIAFLIFITTFFIFKRFKLNLTGFFVGIVGGVISFFALVFIL